VTYLKVDWRVRTFRYPIRKRLYNALIEVLAYPRIWFSSFSFWLFHISMALVILSWLAMDLPFFALGMDESIFEPGGLVYPFRIFHRYVGALFIFGFLLYAGQLATNKKLREGLSLFDYVEFSLIAVIVAYGFSYTVLSWFGYALPVPFTVVKFTLPWKEGLFVVPLHIFIVYGWFISSIIFNGAIMKVIACVLIVFLRGVSLPAVAKAPRMEVYSDRPFDNLTRYGVLQLLACGKCGDCIDACPVYEEMKDDRFSPRARLLNYRLEALKQRGLIPLFFKRGVSRRKMRKLEDMLYGCTICGRCITVCPNELELVEIWKAARESASIGGFVPEVIEKLSSTINSEKNLYGLPNSSRADWVDFESAEVPRKEKAETIYFIGCLTSYTGRLGRLAKAVSALLTYFGEDWTILGGEEWCCGAPLELGGVTFQLKEIAKHNVEAIEATGARKVVFNCPACYRVFKEKYPSILGRKLNFECLHIVEYLNLKLKERGLTGPKFEGVVAYHDPCELTRLLGLFNEPRAVISRFAENFVELPENLAAGRCCGGGGVMKAVMPDVSSKLAATRIKQVMELKVDLLLSGCPACYLTLGDAAASEGLPVRVADVAELVAEQLGLV
jgi:Fe-S oxidoreductase